MKYERRNTNVRHKTLADARQSTVAGGFTLIELITVIIIIGIMLGVALPKYMKMAEKTKASNAKRIMDIIRKAEEAWYAENSAYVTITDSGSSITAPASGADDYDFLEEIPKAKIESDLEWDYSVSETTDAFTVTASRKSGKGPVTGTITLDNNGDFNYSVNTEKYWK